MTLPIPALIIALALSAPATAQQPHQLPFPVAQFDTFDDGGRTDDRLRIVVITSASFPDSAPVVAAWSDPRITPWLDTHAIILKYRNSGFGSDQPDIKRLQGRPPGVAAFRNGELIDVAEPPRSADGLLDWLERVRTRGITHPFAEQQIEDPARTGSPISTLVFAERLARLGLEAETDAAFARVLELRLRCSKPHSELDSRDPVEFEQHALHMYLLTAHRPSLALCNPSTATDLHARARRAVERDADLRERFLRLRDELAVLVNTKPADRHVLGRWLEAQAVVPDAASLHAWFALAAPAPPEDNADGWTALKGLAEGVPAASAAAALRDEIVERLVALNAWRLAGEFLETPIEVVESYASVLKLGRLMWEESRPSSHRTEALANADRTFALRCAVVYAALLAAARDADAAAVAERALEIADPTLVRAALVLGAMRCSRLKPFHVEWAETVDAAKTEGEPLAPAIRKALAEQPKRPD